MTPIYPAFADELMKIARNPVRDLLENWPKKRQQIIADSDARTAKIIHKSQVSAAKSRAWFDHATSLVKRGEVTTIPQIKEAYKVWTQGYDAKRGTHVVNVLGGS